MDGAVLEADMVEAAVDLAEVAADLAEAAAEDEEGDENHETNITHEQRWLALLRRINLHPPRSFFPWAFCSFGAAAR